MKLKSVSDLFVGVQELNKLIQSLDDSGFRKLFLKNSIQFGLFNNSVSGNFTNGKISVGTNVGTIKNEELYALNNEGQVIYRTETDNISIANDSQWRWLKISHVYSSNESYLVSIDAQGNLSAPGGNLTEILRGSSNNASVISFPNAAINTREYAVQSVIDDEHAILAGNFLSESNLTIAVVGSFTPNISPSIDSKYPFQYDSCVLTAVLEIAFNTPPSLIEGKEFLIARVRRTGGTVVIEDKRTLNIYRDKADYELSNISQSTNPLIGIESVKFDSNNTPRDKNLVQIAWAFRSSNWTSDSSANRVTLIGGLGGKFKSTSNFTNGDFDGWRLYFKSGKYAIVKQSTIVATQINLILDQLNPDELIDTAQQLIVAPNAESIQLVFTSDSQDSDENTLGDKIVECPINQEFAVVALTCFDSASYYNVKYAYKNFQTYSELVAIPSDIVNGYLTEASFDDNGNQIASVRQIYTSDDELGFIILNIAVNTYKNVLTGIVTGDLFGVTEYSIVNATPVYDLKVGVQRQVQVFTGSLVFSVDHYINIKSDSAINGNYFILDFRGNYTLGGNSLKINSDFVSTGIPGINLISFTSFEIAESLAQNLVYKVIFDGTNWLVEKVISLSFVPEDVNNKDIDGALTANSDIKYCSQKAIKTYITAYTAGFAAPLSRTITAGSGLSGGGNFSADRTFDVNVDGSTIEINSDTLRVKDSGITGAKIASGAVVKSSDAVQLLTKVIPIGDWNMFLNSNTSVAHGLSNHKKIRDISITIRDDADTVYYLLNGTDGSHSGPMQGGVTAIDSTAIFLDSTAGGVFNSISFDSTSYNRGYITIIYEA